MPFLVLAGSLKYVEERFFFLFWQKCAMEYWRDQGAPAEKLLMGFPTYGRSLKLSSSSTTGLCASISGAGTPGPYTEEAGYWAYFEV